MSKFITSKMAIAAVSMFFAVLTCGTALANNDEQHTKVHIGASKVIWEKPYQDHKLAFVRMYVHDENNKMMIDSIKEIKNSVSDLSLDYMTTAPANTVLILHIDIGYNNFQLNSKNPLASPRYTLRSIDQKFINDGADKNYVLEQLFGI